MTVHLAAHSYFSLLNGIPKPADLAFAAADAGHTAIALTDHNRLTGVIEFTLACQGRNIKPILGMEVSLPGRAGRGVPLVLLAMNAEGWANLCRLSSRLQADQHGETQQLPPQKLLEHESGLLALASTMTGADTLGSLDSGFGDRLYLQLTAHHTDQETEKARRAGIPAAAVWPIYYLRPEQAGLQKLLAAMRQNITLDRLQPDSIAPESSYFPTDLEWQDRFDQYPDAKAATDEIAARCNFVLPLGKPIFPALDLPQGQTPIVALREKAYAGARRLYGELTAEISARLEHELDGIRNSGYTTLFLIMEEIVSFARQADVPLSSRGSAASSLVAHCLGITTPDPVRLNLYFERFLNPARPTPPDVDTDICSRQRDTVIGHVYEKYGSERVAMVATINRFRRRSALREVAKAHGLSLAQIKAMVDVLPYRYWGPPRSPRKEERPYGDLEERFKEEPYQAIFQHAEAILDMPDHLSIHPGGIVISAGPLNDIAPTQYSSKGITITQFDLTGVQHMGLVKMDLLGIRGLTVLGDVADQIRMRSPEMGETRLDVLERIPHHDARVAELVRNGRTVGCFQIESPGMRATLKEVQADSVDNVMVALALFRPGPLTGGLKDAFVRRHLGREKVHHLHLALAPLLEETHGVFLYQEQVLRVAHELAGFSLAESDLLRRAMSHFDPGKRMQTLKEKFIAGARQRHQVPADVAIRIWDIMAAFAGYGFPKAHAASYALTAWRSAWCKAYYPAEFMAAVLANWGGYYSQKTYLAEAKRMGLKIRAPHINYSRSQFSVAYIDGEAQFFMGLDQLRDLTAETQERIQRRRPFTSLADFLTRAYPRKTEVHNLIAVGALDGLGSIPNLLADWKKGAWQRGQMPLFATDADPLGDWTEREKIEIQKTLLGVSLIDLPTEVPEEISTPGSAMDEEEAAFGNGDDRLMD